MSAPVTFTDPEAARYFCRAAGFPMRGTGFDRGEVWIKRATALAARMAAEPPAKPHQAPRGTQRVAMIVSTYKKGKGASFAAVPCQRCGTFLTNPQSIAAGIGPECMAK